MRAGYDRVYSDTRRPPIPDLPVDVEAVRSRIACDKAESDSITTLIFGSVFVFILVIGVTVAFLYAPSMPRTSAIEPPPNYVLATSIEAPFR